MKKVLWIGVVGILLLVALLLVLWGSIDSIVKRAVEGVGSQAAGAPVTLADVNISLTSGQASMNGLKVANPPGFATDSAIRLGGIKVVLDTSTVGSDTIVIKEVVIDGPQVTYEVGAGGTNIGAIQANLEKFTGGGGTAKPGEATPAEEGGGKKLIIETLTIQEGRVEVAATFLGDRKVGATLASVTLKDIGKDRGGATSGEVAKEILEAITGRVMKAVKKLDLDALKKGFQGALEGAKELLGK